MTLKSEDYATFVVLNNNNGTDKVNKERARDLPVNPFRDV